MTLPRVVAPETLDELPPEDPDAQRSRRDLQRIHRFMGTHGLLRGALQAVPVPQASDARLRILELGAGDGTLMLRVARALAPAWPAVELTLLDRQPVVATATVDAYARLGWEARVCVVDVLEWATGLEAESDTGRPRHDMIIASLFLHHFEGAALARLLQAVAARTDRFFACEPRRSHFALVGSRLVGVIGANAVTRQDAVLSVHAGFRDRELSGLWPSASVSATGDGRFGAGRERRTDAAGEIGWRLQERAAGLFSHTFSAVRAAAGDAAPGRPVPLMAARSATTVGPGQVIQTPSGPQPAMPPPLSCAAPSPSHAN